MHLSSQPDLVELNLCALNANSAGLTDVVVVVVVAPRGPVTTAVRSNGFSTSGQHHTGRLSSEALKILTKLVSLLVCPLPTLKVMSNLTGI